MCCVVGDDQVAKTIRVVVMIPDLSSRISKEGSFFGIVVLEGQRSKGKSIVRNFVRLAIYVLDFVRSRVSP